MERQSGITTFGSQFSQVAWVVKDIQVTEKFFREVYGVTNFVRMENVRAEETEGTYQGKPGNFSFHLYMAYSGGTLLEIIQPVSGQSIYQDFLEKYQEGGVQHIAFTVLDLELENAITEFSNKGYSVVQGLTLPVAKVAYFDTSNEIGVMTEIIGITSAGLDFVNRFKNEMAA